MDRNLVDTLTPRQRECLKMVGRGLVAKEIARELRLSPDTVAIHIKAGMAKLHVSSRREAGRIVVAHEVTAAPNPDRASPAEMIGTPASIAEDQMPVADGMVPDRLEEVRTAFGHRETVRLPLPEPVGPASGSSPSRVLTVVLLAIAIAVVVLMAFPLSESFQRIANLVDPPTR